MPYLSVRRVSGTYAPTATGATNLAIISNVSPTGVTQKGSVWRIIGFSCRVVVASNGTGTVSFGTTAGTATSIASTAEVGSATTGLKLTFTGADLAGSGLTAGGTVAQAIDYLTGTYTIGTDTVTPVIRYTLLVVKNEHWLDVVEQ